MIRSEGGKGDRTLCEPSSDPYLGELQADAIFRHAVDVSDDEGARGTEAGENENGDD